MLGLCVDLSFEAFYSSLLQVPILLGGLVTKAQNAGQKEEEVGEAVQDDRGGEDCLRGCKTSGGGGDEKEEGRHVITILEGNFL